MLHSRHLSFPQRLIRPVAAGLAVATLVACSDTKEVTVERTVIVEQTVVRTVVATPTPSTMRARATAVVFGSSLTADGLAVNPRNAFPTGTSQVHAVVLVENAPPGTTITGTWFQLGTAGAGEEGQPIVTGDVILSQVGSGGRSRVTFTLKRDNGALPRDSWLFRVYANGVLLKTASFVISDLVPQTPRLPGTTSFLKRTVEEINARHLIDATASFT